MATACPLEARRCTIECAVRATIDPSACLPAAVPRISVHKAPAQGSRFKMRLPWFLASIAFVNVREGWYDVARVCDKGAL